MGRNSDSGGIINCLIIDDDPFIHSLLQDKLSQYFEEIKVLGIARSGRQGIEKIKELRPELIFLDVEMPDMTGFEMLSKLDEITFRTIFITSYSHYAIKAIRFNALDYLLKPFDLEELKEALQRYQKENRNSHSENLKRALQNLHTPEVIEHEFVLNTQGGNLNLKVKDIIRIQGDRNYSQIHLNNGARELVTKTLGDLEKMLEGKGFFRVHKSHLINFIHIQEKDNNNPLVLSDGTEIPVARRKKEAFQNWLRDIA